MANVAHEPVKKAMSRIRELSADEEARRLAFVRERALRDEVSLLNEARQDGEARGEVKGEAKTLLKLIQLKFGDQPGWVEDKLNAAGKAQLDHWVAVILTAGSLEELFGE